MSKDTLVSTVQSVDGHDRQLVGVTIGGLGRITVDSWAPGFVMPQVGEDAVCHMMDGLVRAITIGGRYHNQTAPLSKSPPAQPPRDPELRRAALAVITANARWLGSGAEDVEYEGLQKAVNALREALAK